MSKAPVQTPSIVAIEAHNGTINSTFKFPLTDTATPKQLVASVAKKAGLAQTEFFGLAVKVPAPVDNQAGQRPYIGSQLSLSSPLSDEYSELCFLLDDIPVVEQIQKKATNDLVLAIKYCFHSPQNELHDSKTVAMMYHQMSVWFKNFANEAITPKMDIAVGLQCHIFNVRNDGVVNVSLVQNVREFTPKKLHSIINDGFCAEVQNVINNSSKQSIESCMKQFLQLVKLYYPTRFYVPFSCLHVEYMSPFSIYVSSDGLFFDLEKSNVKSPQLMVPHTAISGWTITSLDDDLSESSNNSTLGRSKGVGAVALVGMAAGKGTPSMSRKFKVGSGHESFLKNILLHIGSHSNAQDALAIESERVEAISIAFPKKMLSRIEPESLGYSPGSLHRYAAIIYLHDPSLKPIEFILLSSTPSNYKLAEQLHFHNVRASSPTSLSHSLDDLTSGFMSAVAKESYTAASPSELSLIQGDDVVIVRQLDANSYLASLNGKEGTVSASHLSFEKRKGSAHRRTVIENGISKKVAGGEVFNIYIMDGTRKSTIANEITTVHQIVLHVAEKLDIPQPEFLGLYEVTDSGDRFLDDNCTLFQLGISTVSKLLIKLRLLFHDVAELTDPGMVYLYYLQTKQFILNGAETLSEAETIDFASLQMQATYGDADGDKQKFTTVLNLLPSHFQKMTLSKTESWWQKRIMSAHQQHKGISKTEAEKAYIAMAQRISNFGYQMFIPKAPDSFMVGISRDHIIVLDKANQTSVQHKFPTDFANISIANHSLVLDLSYTGEGAAPQSIRFLTSQLLEFLACINFLKHLDAKRLLKKRIKALRELFGILEIYMLPDMSDKELHNVEDPELFLLTIKSGAFSRAFGESLKRLLSTQQSGETSRIEDLPDANPNFFKKLHPDETAECHMGFMRFCELELKLPVDILCTAEEFTSDFNMGAMVKIVMLFESIFSLSPVKAGVDAIAEHHRIHKTRKRVPGQLSSSSPSSASNNTAMTQQDFMLKVLEEIYNTELSYAKDMEMVVKKFVIPLKARVSGVANTDFVEHDFLQMFGNIADLSHFHQALVQRLEPACKSTNQVAEVGRCFSENAERFSELYIAYCSNHSEPADRLPDLKSASSDLLNIIGFNGDTSNDQLAKHNLSSQLIKPVQRIMRYHLLLKELVRYTPENDSGFSDLELGLQKMKDVATMINEVKRTKENERILENLQAKIEGFDAPLMFGELKSSGVLTIVEKTAFTSKTKFGATMKDASMHCFLFEDILLSCRESKKTRGNQQISTFKFKSYIYTRDISTSVKLSEIPVDEKLSFELIRADTQKSYIFTANSIDERDRWLQVLADCSSKSLSKPSSERVDIDTMKKRSSDLSFVSQESGSSKSIKMFNTVKKLSSWKRDPAADSIIPPEAMDSMSGLLQSQPGTPKSTRKSAIDYFEGLENPLSGSSTNLTDNYPDRVKTTDSEAMGLRGYDNAEIGDLTQRVDDLHATVKSLLEASLKLNDEITDSHANEARLRLQLDQERAKQLLTPLAEKSGTNYVLGPRPIIYKSAISTSAPDLPNGNNSSASTHIDPAKAVVLRRLNEESEARKELVDNVKRLSDLLANFEREKAVGNF